MTDNTIKLTRKCAGFYTWTNGKYTCNVENAGSINMWRVVWSHETCHHNTHVFTTLKSARMYIAEYTREFPEENTVTEKLPIESKQYATEYKQGLDMLATVHSLPADAPQCPLKTGRAKYSYANYWAFEFIPSKITVSKSAPDFYLSMFHEIGHYIDHAVFGSMGVWWTDQLTGNVKLLFTEIFASQAYQNIKNSNMDSKTKNYLLNNRELFARAYAQFVAHKAGYKFDLNKNKFQWESADFENINAAFELIFENL